MRKYINLGLFLAHAVTIALVTINGYKIQETAKRFSQCEMKLQEVQEKVDSISCHLQEKTQPIKVKKKFTSTILKTGTFYGFKIAEPVDTSVSNQLKVALETYCGPEVKINSLKRHYNHKSMHYHGNAVDLEFCDELIEHLLSEDGQAWLASHQLSFYIEGKPGSKRVKEYAKYEKYKDYVFFNAAATGNHIHLYAKV